MGSLSNSSPIFTVAEFAWITSIGKWRTWVRARNYKRDENKTIIWGQREQQHAAAVTNPEQLTSSCPPQAAVCSTSLQYFSNSSGNQNTHTHIKSYMAAMHRRNIFSKYNVPWNTYGYRWFSFIHQHHDQSVTCCVHVSGVGVSEERQEVISMASHVLGRVGSQLFHTHD